MTGFSDVVQWQTVSGDSVTVDGVTVTPQSQALTVRWPNGGFVWNRPVAVLVEQGGITERIRITDVNLVVRLGLLGLSLFISAVFLLSARKRRESNG
jgi:hypothetical protein